MIASLLIAAPAVLIVALLVQTAVRRSPRRGCVACWPSTSPWPRRPDRARGRRARHRRPGWCRGPAPPPTDPGAALIGAAIAVAGACIGAAIAVAYTGAAAWPRSARSPSCSDARWSCSASPKASRCTALIVALILIGKA